ncbi:MAG: phosphopantetheine-binding protein [Acidobacteriota bacterium]
MTTLTQEAPAEAVDTAAIETLIVDFIREDLSAEEGEEIDLDDNLLTSGLVDSVGIVRLIAHLKAQLDVDVPPKDLVPTNFRTIRIMAAYMGGLVTG